MELLTVHIPAGNCNLRLTVGTLKASESWKQGERPWHQHVMLCTDGDKENSVILEEKEKNKTLVPQCSRRWQWLLSVFM